MVGWYCRNNAATCWFLFIFLLSHGGGCKRLLLLYGGALQKRTPEKISPPLFSRAEKQGRQKAGRYPDPGDYPGIWGYRAPSPQNRKGNRSALHRQPQHRGASGGNVQRKKQGGYLSPRTDIRTYPAHQAKDDNNNVKVRPLAIRSSHGMGSRPQASRRLPHLRSANQLFPPAVEL